MDKLTLNIIHTNYGYHHLMTESNKLRSQLYYLAEMDFLLVNILLNGDEAINNVNEEGRVFRQNMEDKGVTFLEHRGKPLTHGSAIQYLHDNTTTRKYICIDEDDEFVENFGQVLFNLYEFIDQHWSFYGLISYGFIWQWKNSEGELRQKYHPIETSEFQNFPPPVTSQVIGESISGLSNWNFVFDKHWLDERKIVRPDVNKYDDNLYYLKLQENFPTAILFNTPVLIYRKDHATLSNEVENPFDKYMEYLLKGKDLYLTLPSR